jgi:hypothetical protein
MLRTESDDSIVWYRCPEKSSGKIGYQTGYRTVVRKWKPNEFSELELPQVSAGISRPNSAAYVAGRLTVPRRLILLLQLASSAPPIGSKRTRIRVSSKTTMHPCPSALVTLGRLVSTGQSAVLPVAAMDGGAGLLTVLSLFATTIACRSRYLPKSVHPPHAPPRRGQPYPVPLAYSSPEHAWHHGLLVVTRRQRRATAHCRREISRSGDKRELPLANRVCSEV